MLGQEMRNVSIGWNRDSEYLRRLEEYGPMVGTVPRKDTEMLNISQNKGEVV